MYLSGGGKACSKYRKTKEPKCEKQEDCQWVVGKGCRSKDFPTNNEQRKLSFFKNLTKTKKLKIMYFNENDRPFLLLQQGKGRIVPFGHSHSDIETFLNSNFPKLRLTELTLSSEFSGDDQFAWITKRPPQLKKLIIDYISSDVPPVLKGVKVIRKI